MTQDLNKGISKIEYNLLNLPHLMDIKSPVGEARNEYLYSATGTKLRVKQRYNSNYNNAPIIGSEINVSALDKTKTTDYVNNKVYENSNLKRILIDDGYVEYNGYEYQYHFFTKDHLGNNRFTTNLSNLSYYGDANNYYPFGMALESYYADTPQPYKYNGKEMDKMHRLNLYDYSARYYDATMIRFTSIDPLSEKSYSESPYVYVSNNPIKYFDPDGKEKLNGLYGKDPKDVKQVEKRKEKDGKDNGIIHIYAHGQADNALVYVDDKGVLSVITNVSKMKDFLNKYSETWKTRGPKERIIIALHACNSGKTYPKSGGSFAEIMSMDLPDYVTIMAPSERLHIVYDGEYIEKDGVWNVYNKGEKIASFRGTFENNPDMLPYQRPISTPNLSPSNSNESDNKDSSAKPWWGSVRRRFFEQAGF